jgi:hypothetical protein
LQHYRASGQISHSQIGNKIYYPADALQKLLSDKLVSPKTR